MSPQFNVFDHADGDILEIGIEKTDQKPYSLIHNLRNGVIGVYVIGRYMAYKINIIFSQKFYSPEIVWVLWIIHCLIDDNVVLR